MPPYYTVSTPAAHAGMVAMAATTPGPSSGIAMWRHLIDTFGNRVVQAWAYGLDKMSGLWLLWFIVTACAPIRRVAVVVLRRRGS